MWRAWAPHSTDVVSRGCLVGWIVGGVCEVWRDRLRGLLGGRFVDAPGQQIIDPVDWMAFCDAGQDVREVGFRVQAIDARGLHDGVDAGGPHPAVVGAGEQVVLPAQSN